MNPISPQTVAANGLEFCVEQRGDPKGEPLILIMGLAAQLTLWPETMLERYVQAGFRVIRFDNRDIGLSSEIKARLQGKPLTAMARYKLGMTVPAPYKLYDMAEDVVGLMDALDIPQAHIKGVSMGGMVGQILAARYPARVKSLTLVMTSNNSRKLPMPAPKVIWGLQGSNIKGHHENAAVARSLALWRNIQSPLYPRDEKELAERIRSDYRRSYRPGGILRQMRGILATGDLSTISRGIRVPTAIIHGKADPLVRPVAAKQLQALIPGSKLHWIQGMGHDMPEPLMDELTTPTLKLAGRT
ncbi:MAG: alpha/beta hydrolase [Oleiphilaceae bacterium]|nr:alpha/beta hydrolase [Oleiphilaceae bacterium]